MPNMNGISAASISLRANEQYPCVFRQYPFCAIATTALPATCGASPWQQGQRQGTSQAGLSTSFVKRAELHISYPLMVLCLYFATEMRGTPNTAEIRANVDSVKLWPPPIHRDTAAADVPRARASSFCVIPFSFSASSISSAIWNDHSICCLKSCGVLATASRKCFAPATSFFIYRTLYRLHQIFRFSQCAPHHA